MLSSLNDKKILFICPIFYNYHQLVQSKLLESGADVNIKYSEYGNNRELLTHLLNNLLRMWQLFEIGKNNISPDRNFCTSDIFFHDQFILEKL